MSSTASSGAQAPSTVVIYSGGMDSYTVLHRALREGLAVHALSFDYGQRHRRELDVARQVCESLAIPHQVVDIRAIHGLIDNSALTNAALTMPQGEYDADSLHSTVVPNRNMILLSLAIAKAVNIGASRVDYGAHGGDHMLYPDCRPAFVEAFERLANLATRAGVEGEGFRIRAPLQHLSKAQIIQAGQALGVDYSQTVSCYQADEQGRACGVCDSCRLRAAGFAAAGVPDATRYQR